MVFLDIFLKEKKHLRRGDFFNILPLLCSLKCIFKQLKEKQVRPKATERWRKKLGLVP